MHTHQIKSVFVAIVIILLLASCASPHDFPAGLTSIPTLIPATEPSGVVGATNVPVVAIQSYPARLPSVERGQTLYNANCAECHGTDGNGVVPGARNFGDLDYMRGETPASFYNVVTEGRSQMPAFQDILTSDERWDVVFYVWAFSTSADVLAEGQQLYDTNCAACHGEDGTGEVLGSADFTDLRQIDDLAPRDFYLVVTQGRGSMPAWQGRLSQDERWAVIDYLRTFSYDPSLPGQRTTAPEPTEEAAGNVCEEYESQSNPFAWDDEAASGEGRVIYEQNCAMCHGPDGSGSIPNAPDFSTDEFQSELRDNTGEMLCIVAVGREAMPGWANRLSIEQMWQVLTFLSTLGD